MKLFREQENDKLQYHILKINPFLLKEQENT